MVAARKSAETDAMHTLNDKENAPQQKAESAQPAVLQVRDLRVAFPMGEGKKAWAVDGVFFSVDKHETLGLVGESGCGKSVTALSILKLTPPPGRIEQGAVLFQGRDLATLDEKGMRDIRGNRIGMIFQEPMTSLNPLHSVGDQVAEVFLLHGEPSRRVAWKKAVEMLDRVRIPEAGQRAKDYPHHLSGGMRQRVMIAMALALDPDLLIADEPTTALDVTVQAQILQLIDSLRDAMDAGVLLITHDLGVVAEAADRVAVMYAGQIVETGTTDQLLDHPAHPYTRALLRSVPRLAEKREVDALQTIAGAVPNPADWPAGCRFHPRCPLAQEVCSEKSPELETLQAGQWCRCFFPQDKPL